MFADCSDIRGGSFSDWVYSVKLGTYVFYTVCVLECAAGVAGVYCVCTACVPRVYRVYCVCAVCVPRVYWSVLQVYRVCTVCVLRVLCVY